MLCQVHLKEVSDGERELLDYMFFHPLDKLEERDEAVILNYGGGKLCRGSNDFGESCGNCRYMPYFIRQILQRQKALTFGREPKV